MRSCFASPGPARNIGGPNPNRARARDDARLPRGVLVRALSELSWRVRIPVLGGTFEGGHGDCLPGCFQSKGSGAPGPSEAP
jgi:hypothetical protein